MIRLEFPEECLEDVLKVVRAGLLETANSTDKCGNRAWEMLNDWWRMTMDKRNMKQP